MKWSATMTTRDGSKTRSAPIFSIARNATGPETSFAITTSQRTVTTSPGRTSSASQCASRIFSTSVCANQALQRREALVERHDVAVLEVDVVQRRVVGRRVPVADRLARHDGPVAVLQHVDGRRADAARGRRAGDDDAVALVRGEQARERRPEERGRVAACSAPARSGAGRSARRSRPSSSPASSVSSAGTFSMNAFAVTLSPSPYETVV